jgi:MFS family permease
VARSEARLITPTFAAVMAAAFAFFMYAGVLIPIIPRFVEDDLRGGELGIGLAIASFAGAAIAFRPIIGRLIDRHGRRAVMVGGGLLAAVAGFLYGYADSLPTLLVLRAASGIGEATLFVGAATLVADLSPEHRRAEGASYFSVAVFAGIGIGPTLGEVMMNHYGLRPAFALAAAFAVLAAMISLALPARVGAGPTPVEVASGGPEGRLVIDIDSSRRGPFVHPAALGPGIVLATGIAAFAVFPAFLPDYSRSLGLSGSGGLFAVYSAVCLVLRAVGAKVPERLGPRASVTFAYTVLGLAFALFAAVPHQWALWLATGLVGLGVAFMYPSLMALTVARAPERERPRAIASFTMFFELGSATGGLAIGAIADSFGKRSGFGVAALVCTFGIWVLRARVLPGRASNERPAVAPASTPAVAVLD